VKFLLPCFLLKLFLDLFQDPVLKDSYFMKQITWLIYGSVLSLHYGLLVFIRVQCFVFDGEDVRYIYEAQVSYVREFFSKVTQSSPFQFCSW
jgi:hypothetical protein